MGLGEGLAPSSATNVMARQVPECAPPAGHTCTTLQLLVRGLCQHLPIVWSRMQLGVYGCIRVWQSCWASYHCLL